MDENKRRKENTNTYSVLRFKSLRKATHSLRGNKQPTANKMKKGYFSLVCTEFFQFLSAYVQEYNDVIQ